MTYSGRLRSFGRALAIMAAATIFGALCRIAQAQTSETGLLALEKPPVLAPVTIDGRILFQVRGVTAYPAAERARAIATRIEEAASDPFVSTTSLQLVEGQYSTDILAGNRPLLSVFNADVAAEAPGVARQVLAKLYSARIVAAIVRYRAERVSAHLLHQISIALGGTFALAAALLALFGISKWVNGRIERKYKSTVATFESKTHRLISAQSIWKALHTGFKILSVTAAVFLLFAYVHFVLSLFPWTRESGENLRRLALAPLITISGKAATAVPNLILVALLIFGARYLLKVTRLAFNSVKDGRLRLGGFDPEWSDPTYNIVRILIIFFVVVVSYPFIPGSESPAFKGVTIFIGVLFSLGSSSFLANLIAGYTMTYRRAFHTGDRIQIGELLGDVTEVGLMVTHLRSVKNEEFFVPNSLILNSNVINYSSLARERGLILHTTLGIGYETPWRQVEAMLLLAAERTPSLLQEPPPFVLQKSLGDYAINYELNAYCDKPSAMYQLYTDLHRNILDVFNEFKVQIMTPSYVADPSAPKVVPGDQWFAQPAQTPALRKTGTD